MLFYSFSISSFISFISFVTLPSAFAKDSSSSNGYCQYYSKHLFSSFNCLSFAAPFLKNYQASYYLCYLCCTLALLHFLLLLNLKILLHYYLFYQDYLFLIIMKNSYSYFATTTICFQSLAYVAFLLIEFYYFLLTLVIVLLLLLFTHFLDATCNCVVLFFCSSFFYVLNDRCTVLLLDLAPSYELYSLLLNINQIICHFIELACMCLALCCMSRANLQYLITFYLHQSISSAQ